MFWDYSGKQDVYLEIARRYERYIYDGLYKNGEKLPSVREVASATAKGTFRILARDWASIVLPQPVGPSMMMLLF